MIDKTLVYVLIGAGLVVLLVGGLLGWYVKPEKNCPIIIDTVLVKGDTIPIPYPVEVIKWKEKQPGIPNIDSTVYTAVFDSSFVSHKDTIGIIATVSHNEKTKEFLLENMEIEHKDYDFFRVDTLKKYYPKEVEVNNPDWITATVTSTVLLLLAIIALIVGG